MRPVELAIVIGGSKRERARMVFPIAVTLSRIVGYRSCTIEYPRSPLFSRDQEDFVRALVG